MKKYSITMLVAATVALAGCGMTQEQMMMMDEMKTQLNEVQSQVNEVLFQANSNAAAADSAREMAEEALIKASMKKKSSRGMMHQKKMMK